MHFSELSLNPSLLNRIEQLGYQQATEVQQQAIPAILKGQDVMAGAQTGTGKTAAFALPIIHRLMEQIELEPSKDNEDSKKSTALVKALVLTPTRELAQQVFQSFSQYAKKMPVKIVQAYGGVSLNPQLDKLAKGCDVLVATPGRLLDFLFKGAVSLEQLNYLVFDEADRMLDMGFMREINRILKRVPEQRQTLLFSATFDDAIHTLSKRLLKEPTRIQIAEKNAAAANVEQTVYQVDKDKKRALVSYLIGRKNWQQVLVFTRTKNAADALAKEMSKDGLETQAIHGDKSQGARDRALLAFKEGSIRALVATDVAARGIDIPSLEVVINYELPHVAEDYVHRIGRTGRAGKTGLAISLCSADEQFMLEEIELVIKQRLTPQWYPGFEPDLDNLYQESGKNSKKAQKHRDKLRASGRTQGARRSKNGAKARKR
ncbi:DEAD/DEAH box helicase [Catenovulum sp. SM1970]|uniref:DEAD/DEAH box helicase n=1 Tax=Marinifaba aquimaris TaxID=2741323 RepID=UPI0015716720|nr:DEAD/DEAH box helicase [Marinifaba aquimaris]NTS75528.1 DEAD/DEAH box helicase [Marinifaba aquimaris]